MRFRGVYGPVITPFTASGDLDRAGFEQNIRAHMQQGLAGAVVCGSTGEAALLSETERQQLVAWARPLIGAGRQLLAGVGAESTRTTVHYARQAAAAGADAALVIAPHYFASSMTDEALRAHFLRVADDSPIPVVLYNNPKYMHYKMSPALVGELARHGNVVGIKDSLGQRDLFASYMQCQSPTFTVLTGNGTFLQTAMELGAPGGILAVSLFAPEMALAVFNAMERQDPAAAAEMQERLTPLARVIVGELGPAGVKVAMDLVGLRGGAPRSPLLPLPKPEVQRVEGLLREAQLEVAA